jgi:eukaryotic-like serine/threonine-protein kinase
MRKCHECESEVTDADVFCPFCGLSLQPVVLSAEPEPVELEAEVIDDSLESTIMMPLEEAVKLAGGARAEQEDPAPAIAAETVEDPAVDEEPTVDVDRVAESGPTVDVDSVADEVPPPGILSDLTKLEQPQEDESTPKGTSANFSTSDTGPVENPVIDEVLSVNDLLGESPEKEEREEAADSIYVDSPPMIAEEPESPAGLAPIEVEQGLSEEGSISQETPIAEADSPIHEFPQPEAVGIETESSERTEAPEDDFSWMEEPARSDASSIEPPASTPVIDPQELKEATVTPEREFDLPEPPIPEPIRQVEQSDGKDNRFSTGETPFYPEEIDQENIDTRLGYPGIQEISKELSIPDMTAEEKKDPSEPAPARGYTSPNIGEGDTDGRRSAKLTPLVEGTVLNSRYEIVRKIGGGGMGAVYLATDNNLGGVLRAVKEMVQAHIEEDQQEKAISDFKRESMILSTLDHPCIPTIFDYFYDEAESRFYLVMKYISGGDLAARLKSAPEGKLEEAMVTEWAIQITDVLHYLHTQPATIVYRDLKPSNIMLDGNSGRIMLIDFGIARSISQKEEKGVTAVGTMGYAPPELFSGNVEPRSDIYSLGSTMFHLLTGADPQSNPLLIFDFQKHPRPRQINSRLSDQMEKILMKAVEYSADARFSSAKEMGDALKQHLESLKRGQATFGVSAVPASVSLENLHVFCGFCGQKIVATDLFCAFCGSKQPIAQQGVQSGIYSNAAPTARLVIEGTSELSAPVFTLQKEEILVGRRDPMSNIFPEVDLSKYDPQTKISRRHARIWRHAGNYMVEDLGSSNGTLLMKTVTDPVRLSPHTPHALVSGDRLKVGDMTLHFLVN